MKQDRFIGLMMAVGYILIVLAVAILSGCGKSNVKPDPALVLVKAPAEVRIEKVPVEVTSPIPKDMLKGYPCAYPQAAPLSDFVTVDFKKTTCLETYKGIIDAVIKKYGVK